MKYCLDKKKEKFFKLIHYTPIHDKALSFHSSPGHITEIIGGMRSGKSSSFLPEFIYEAITKKNQNFWIVSLDYSLTDRFIFGKGTVSGVETILRQYMPFLIKKVDRKGHQLELANKVFIQGKSLKYKESLAAEPVNGIVVEDAETISSEGWENYIRPRVADTGGFIWVNSVPPIDPQHWVYNIQSKSQTDKSILFLNFFTQENPYRDQVEVKNIMDTLPEFVWKRLFGEIPKRKETPLQEAEFSQVAFPFDHKNVYRAGLDIARFGYSQTVLCIACLTQKRFEFYDYFPHKFMKKEFYMDRLSRDFAKYGSPPVNVDSAGLGWGTFEELQRRHYPAISGAVNSLKRRNMLIEIVMMAIERGWTFVDHPVLKRQLSNIQVVSRKKKESLSNRQYEIQYVQRDKSVGDDGVIASGLAVEGQLSFEYIYSDTQDRNKLFNVVQEQDRVDVPMSEDLFADYALISKGEQNAVEIFEAF